MKNTIKILAIIALVAVIGFSMAACGGGGGGKLSGAYESDGTTFTFTGNKVTNSFKGEVLGEGLFSTSGDELIFYHEEDGERVEDSKFIYSLEGDKLTLSIPGHPEQALVFTKK